MRSAVLAFTVDRVVDVRVVSGITIGDAERECGWILISVHCLIS